MPTLQVCFRRHWRGFIFLGAAIAVAPVLSCRSDPPPPPLDKTFDGNTRDLRQTQVAPTLDTPMEEGKNVVWCATFAAGWKKFQEDVLDEPVALEGADAACARLNAAPNPEADLPEGDHYTAAGWEDQGIVGKVHQDMAKLFPQKRAPTFPGIIPGSFLMYAYLDTGVPFTIPYFESREPLVFVDSAGRATQIRAFGLRQSDTDRYYSLRKQAHVLFATVEETEDTRAAKEFAIDLCRDSTPNQLVFARVEPKGTLASTLKTIEEKSRAFQEGRPEKGLGGEDSLLVPDMFWRLDHHFAEFEDRPFKNTRLGHQAMSVARQDIQFRMDRSGAELSSEAEAYNYSTLGVTYTGEGPFLIYIKKRGAKQPFFALWIDNAELLQPWPSGKE